jgi:hypothetical protein
LADLAFFGGVALEVELLDEQLRSLLKICLCGIGIFGSRTCGWQFGENVLTGLSITSIEV